MKDYTIDTLYDSGFISGEVYYLCSENGISCLADAIKYFNEPNPPTFIESLRLAYSELSEELHLYDEGSSGLNKEERLPSIESTFLQNESLLEELFNDSLKKHSVRANNAIRWLKQDYGTFSEFFKWVLSADFNPLKVRNVGKKTNAELKTWKYGIKKYIKTHQILNDDARLEIAGIEAVGNNMHQKENALLQNESLLEKLFNESLESHSVRAINAMKLERRGYDSYIDFFKGVLSADFNPLQLKNVGSKTVIEIRDWLLYIRYFLYKNPLSCEDEIPNAAKRFVKKDPYSWHKNSLFDELFDFIDSLQNSKKHLAYYLAEKRVDGLTSISMAIKLSRERVRQLLPNLLKSIGGFLKQKRKAFDYTKEDYLNLVNKHTRSINKEFVIWVGTQVSSEIDSIGSYKDFICKGKRYLMVDAKLALVFDFKSFIKKIDSLAKNKYYKESKVSIDNIVLDCFRHDVRFEFLPAITRACRTILYEHYPYHLTESEIIIPPNAHYSIRQRVEDILTKEGRALSLDEIRERLIESGAQYSGSDNQLASMIRTSSIIVPYGYPGRFGLTSWGKPEEEVYGSIRDAAIYILLHQVPHIMAEKDLLLALLSIFTESSERSIASNLMSDSKQRFGIYLKGKTRYIGLNKETYDSSFVLLSKSNAKKPSSSSKNKVSWQGIFDSVKRVLSSQNWTALNDQQRKWLISNWKKARKGTLKGWQSAQILELIDTSKKK